MSSTMDPQADDKQKAFLERARKGILQHLNERGGKLTLSELHDFSLNKYLIQHQSFSAMMETFVNEGLVEYDFVTQETALTEAGKNFIR